MEEELNWKEYDHPIWGVGGPEADIHEILHSVTFPTRIWRKGKFSVIPPSGITFDQWELYDGEDTERFDTLEEAQAAATHPNERTVPKPPNQ